MDGPGSASQQTESQSEFSILAAGKKALEALKSNYDGVLDTIIKVDDASRGIIKNFGESANRVGDIKTALINARSEILKFGGDFKDALAVQNAVTETLNKNIIVGAELSADLYKTSKATGQEYKTITMAFADAGISLLNINKTMKDVIDISVESGVNSKKVSAEVLTNIGMLDKYRFTNGVDGLAKMAANALSMRVSIKDMSSFMEKMFEPEGAIQMVANFQRLGIQQRELLDPSRLMYLSQTDPEHLLEVMTDAMQKYIEVNEQTGKMSINRQGQFVIRELEKLGVTTFDNMSKLGKDAAKVTEVFKNVTFPEFFSDEQKKTVARLSEMKGGGKFEIQVEGKSMDLQQAVQDFSPDKLIGATTKGEEGEKVDTLLKDQQSAQDKFNITINTLNNRLGYFASAAEGSTKALNLFGDTLDTMSNWIEKTFTKKTAETMVNNTIQPLLVSIQNAFGDEGFKGIIDGLKQASAAILTAVKDMIKNSGFVPNNASLDFLEKIIKTLEGNDVLIRPNQPAIRFNKDDLFVAGTNLFHQDNIYADKQQKVDLSPTIQSNSPLDKTDINKIIENKVSGQVNHDVNFRLTIDTPNNPSFDKDELLRYMDRMEFRQALVNTFKETLNKNTTGKLNRGDMFSFSPFMA